MKKLQILVFTAFLESVPTFMEMGFVINFCLYKRCHLFIQISSEWKDTWSIFHPIRQVIVLNIGVAGMAALKFYSFFHLDLILIS